MANCCPAGCRDYAKKYNIKHFYDITDRSDFKANPNYKGVCHIAMAQEGHCLPGAPFAQQPWGVHVMSEHICSRAECLIKAVLQPIGAAGICGGLCCVTCCPCQVLRAQQWLRVRASGVLAAGLSHVLVRWQACLLPPLAGEVLFGTDSHTCNAGAFGQFASGIGNTDAGFILGTGKLLVS